MASLANCLGIAIAIAFAILARVKRPTSLDARQMWNSWGAEKGKIAGKDLEKVLQEVLNREKEGSELLKSQALSSCITFWSLL